MDESAARITPAAAPDTAEAPQPQAVAELRPTHDIVTVGASAGGVDALRRLVAQLPADFRAAVFIVNHISPEAQSSLPLILSRAGPLQAVHAEDGMPIEHGRIHVAPPDCHLLVEKGRMSVVHGPRENRHRPAIDPLFRSAAWAYGPRVVGVVLTGLLDDGTAGLWAIKSCGGTTIVQDPEDADSPEMPLNALAHNRIDHRLPLGQIAELLARLSREPVDLNHPPAPPPGLESEIGFARIHGTIGDAAKLGSPSAFTCPSCRGALWELEEGGHLRYRCHTGHAYSQASLLVDQSLAVEQSLYTALRAVEEKAAALRRLAERWPDRIPGIKQDYESRAREMDQSAEVLRAMLAGEKP